MTRQEGADYHTHSCHGFECPCYLEGLSMADNRKNPSPTLLNYYVPDGYRTLTQEEMQSIFTDPPGALYMTPEEISEQINLIEDEPLSKMYYVGLVVAFVLFAVFLYATFSLYGSR